MEALFEARVSEGCSTLGSCALITITYKRDDTHPAVVSSVQNNHWKEFWRRARKLPSLQNLKWMKVPELTERGQIHHHLVAGPIPPNERLRCYQGKHVQARQFLPRMGRCTCMAHQMSVLWLDITGDSWVVDVRPVLGAVGASHYLSKYLGKGLQDRSELIRLGYTRRWSNSRGWPGSGRLRLLRTLTYGWERVDFYGAAGGKGIEELNPPELLERSGNNYTLAASKRRDVDRPIIAFRRLMTNATNVFTQDVNEVDRN